MQDNVQPQVQEAQAIIEKSHAISPIWFLPFIAALLGAWILFQNISHQNINITIHFASADGIIVDKTKVRYKGVIVGTVKKIELDEEDGVNVVAEIESHAVFLLREKSQFWLVSPKASLTSISGLDTLFSGSYINLFPGSGDQETEFIATEEQPITIPDHALLINLKSDDADSVVIGTPIFYKKIQVGEIVRVRLDESGQFVNIKAFIESRYSNLVKEQSRFWNISGLHANISRAGIDIKLDSLTSLIAGGITFSSPENGSSKLPSNHLFELYDNIKESEQGLNITFELDAAENLPVGAGILFKGHGIGRINTLSYDAAKQLFLAQATINPAYAELVTENAHFWVEKTTVSLSNFKNIGNIITGDYIAFLPSKEYQQESSKQVFNLLAKQPQPTNNLSISLLAENANGLTEGAPVTYKGLIIGNIDKLVLTNKSQKINIKLNIEQEYTYLINKASKFYLFSGIDFNASLKGVSIKSKPLESILKGGIELYNRHAVDRSRATKLSKKHHFHLYPSKQMAMLGKDSFSAPVTVKLLSKELPSVSIGSPVYYHKLPIGEVTNLKLHQSGLMQTSIAINAPYKHLITKNSFFWDISGFEIDASLSGVKVDAESLLSIAAGGIAVEISESVNGNQNSEGDYKLFDSYQQAVTPSKELTILFNHADDLKIGNKLKLKGLEIGEISNLRLNKYSQVDATITVDANYYNKIAKKGSRFWIVKSELSLSGAKNLNTLISGAYIHVEPGAGKKRTTFTGELEQPAIDISKQGLSIILLATNAGSTDIESPVYHRQIQIGEVLNKRLSNDASGVEIEINIYPEYSHLIRENSIFWPASGFNLDVGITGAALKATSLNALIKGGINMSTPDNVALQPASENGKRFLLYEQSKEEWLKWQLKIPQ